MHTEVQHYYGTVLQGTADLKTDACCTAEAPPAWLRSAIAHVHDEVQSRYYGCGLVVPQALEGMRVLDLGCGSGRDVYVLAQLVGATGFVVGVDMTEEQLAVAERHRQWHAAQFGYANVELCHGYIERLGELGLADGSFDVIVSNCVINLVPDKAAVLREAFRLLKPGGELYFSDVYADRRVPREVATDPVLYGECLGGALYWNDFLRLARNAGFTDPRLVEDRPLAVNNEELQAKTGNIRFYSATYRLFKIAELETECEDYGQAVRYRGTSRTTRTASCSTNTTASKPDGSFLSAATPGACCTTHASRNTSSSSATGAPTTDSSPGAAAACPSTKRPRQVQEAAAAAERVVNPSDYEAWYLTPRGAWIAQHGILSNRHGFGAKQ